MKIVPIFGTNLFAIKYSGEKKDEFARLFELWQDPEYLEEFFESNKSDLENGFWGSISIEDAIIETYNYAQEFEHKLLELSDSNEEDQLTGLENIFAPLYDSQYQIYILNKSKAKETWLRIYALQVENNIYIVTGGAIKLTQTMQERRHTNIELRKIENCRRYLLNKGIVDKDGVIEEIES
ncbi:MAG: hypothetical protein K8R35_04530 [Bacteroidales bacterium]|nr:hypothetical protein [Bacteroidales bacterium]